MRKRLLVLALALFAGECFAPGVWTKAAHGQTTVTLLDQTASVSTSNPINPRGAAYFANTHTITLTAGSSYTIRLIPTATSPYNDSYLYLLGPTGTVVGSNDDGGGDIQFLSSKLDYTPQVTGTYTIVATTFSSGRAMTYRVTVVGPPSNVAPPTPTSGIPNVRLTPTPAELPAALVGRAEVPRLW